MPIPETANWLPETVTAEMVTAAAPEEVRVIVLVLVCPTSTDPNATFELLTASVPAKGFN